MNDWNRNLPATHTGDHVRNIAVDIILTIVTCGLFNLWVQAKQIDAVNAMLGVPRYNWLHWFLLTLITCGIYHIYHEYRKSQDIAMVLQQPHSQTPLAMLILTIFGLSVIADAIQQGEINRYYGSNAL